MKQKEFVTLDVMPEVLTAEHISQYLGISRRRVYELFQQSPAHGGIPNYDIGNSKRAEKADLIKWKEAQKALKLARFN